MLAITLYELQQGKEIVLNKKEGMSFLNHLLTFPESIQEHKLELTVEYAFKYKFKLIK